MNAPFDEKKIRILLLEGIHPVAGQRLLDEGFEVEEEAHALEASDLSKRVQGFHALGIRSKTQITPNVIDQNSSFLVIGTFCIGTDQVDLSYANQKGLPVFNAPHSNTRSVAELVLAEIIALSRHLGDRNMMAHRGEWSKSAFGSHEVRGKTLGIVGYGHIGSQVSVLAEGLGLRVIFYDIVKKLPLGNAQTVNSFQDLLTQSDFVSFHVPETSITKGMMGEEWIGQMKKGAYLINASRGSVVEISALAKALKEGHLAGAAIDVYPKEPSSNNEKFESELQNLNNVILTPHIGGSTEEAQKAIGLEVAESFVRFFKKGTTSGAVNFPQLDVPELGESRRLINVHNNVPGVLGDINSIVSELGVNIKAQFLSTDSQIGYLVMDMAPGHIDIVSQRINQLETSIKTRIVK